ncbi:MAG: hypothetical protein EBX37_10800 [Alphaproteobacteria bacterium]|nr:hypothetical protein [Alphaproteobacteria bacterium]
MQKQSPDGKLTIRIFHEWEGVTLRNTHYVRLNIDTGAMVQKYNHRMSEAQQYARKYREQLLKSLKLPEGYTAHAEPDAHVPARPNETNDIIIETPPFKDKPGQSPHATPEALAAVTKAVEAAHELALQAAGDPPGDHAIGGIAGFVGAHARGGHGGAGRRFS